MGSSFNRGEAWQKWHVTEGSQGFSLLTIYTLWATVRYLDTRPPHLTPSINQCTLASLVHPLPPFLPHWGDNFPGCCTGTRCSPHAPFHLSNLLVHLCRDTRGRCFLWDRNRAFKGQECWRAILGEFLMQPSELAVERRLWAASTFPKCKRGHTKPLKR